MKKVFIDGRAGTTGLRIEERLSGRDDIELLALPEHLRKDNEARCDMLNSVDIAFLCLPDAAAIEAVEMVTNPDVCIIDTSTAHRTNPAWAYGFPELGAEFEERIASGKRIAVPGCHACGFISLIYPLIKQGVLSPDSLLTFHSITGYSGGGKSMIADYADSERSSLLDAPRQYGIGQKHKHLPEITAVTHLTSAPVFSPIVSDFYSGMEVTVPLHSAWLCGGATVDDIKEIYKKQYTGPIVYYSDSADEAGFLSAGAYSGRDVMEISVQGGSDRIILVSRYDNLGKGASGAAVECLNILLGTDKTKNLAL